MSNTLKQSVPKNRFRRLFEVLAVSTKLGLTSFGGPIAHLGYFHNEYIRRRKWMDEQSYADLIALCQFLPGPASSQVGIGIGIMRAGLLGGLVAWLGFTLPSVIALIVFAFFMKEMDVSHVGWISGLKIVAVAIVAQAIISMGHKLTPDRNRITIAVAAASAALLWPSMVTQVLLIVVAGIVGWWMYRHEDIQQVPQMVVPINRRLAGCCLVLFFGLLLGLPLWSQGVENDWISLFDHFYRAGSLVFGGGHVVLPLLEQAVVPTGLISKEHFLAGYGITQAVPGPLFTFAAYLGAMMKGVLGALILIIAIFLPSFLLIVGALPFWGAWRSNRHLQGALRGINAAVVGILIAAFYDPLWTTAIVSPEHFVLGMLLFVLLMYWNIPAWIVVLVGAGAGVLLF
ncbi:chromate transporter [Paenibacillus sp. 481]|nr:chromate transporter [Paenibacillus sp. 481]